MLKKLFVIVVILFNCCILFGGSAELENSSDKKTFEIDPNSFSKADHILSQIDKIDPNEAARLRKLQKEDPAKFDLEFRQKLHAAYAKKISNARFKNKDNAFKTEPKTIKLEGITDRKEPFDKLPNDPGLSEMLKKRFQLDEQIRKSADDIKLTTDDKDKQKKTEQLKALVLEKIELDSKRRQTEHQTLLKKMEILQQQVKASAERNRRETAEEKNKRVDEITENLLAPKK